MKISKKKVQENRSRLESACQRVMRGFGIDAMTVSDVAGVAGFTHGAAYRHFANKSDLVRSGVVTSFGKISEWLDRLSKQTKPVEKYIQGYLSKQHRDRSAWGCPLPIAGSSMTYQTEDVQLAFSTALNELVERLEQLDKDDPLERDSAIFLIASLSGAQTLARATRKTNPDLSDEILEVVERKLLQT